MARRERCLKESPGSKGTGAGERAFEMGVGRELGMEEREGIVGKEEGKKEGK